MGTNKKLSATATKAGDFVERTGSRLVQLFHLLGLFVIGATIFWSAVSFYIDLIAAGHASLHDILLLFIYIELGAMVGIYFHTEQLPVEFLLYIAITVVTRTLVSFEELSESRVVVATLSVLVLAMAAVLLRWGSYKFSKSDAGAAKHTDLPQ